MSLAHGLGQDLVARDWPQLTLAELAPVFSRYPGLGAPDAILFHSPRPFAASAIVQADAASVFVKRHAARVRNAADLAEEHAFIAHLRSRGVDVPAVLHTADATTTVTAPGVTYELHALGDGDDDYRDAHSWTPLRNTQDAEAIGHALGRLHGAAEGFAAPARLTRLLVSGDDLLHAGNLLDALHARLADDPLLADALRTHDWPHDVADTLLGWHAALQPHLHALAPLWVHGDLHASNVLWRRGRVSAILDFGLCNRASATYDLATALERNTIAWIDPSGAVGHADLARALLHGYDSVRPRSAAEKRALRHVLPLVHVDFALSELTYFHGVTKSPASAEAAYTDFLLDHSRWFASGAGNRFLNGL